MNPLISVIIPAYNVAPYIRKSVESVINQTYKNLQIILIDDGATDETGKICDELASEDSRVEVIHQKNKGLAGARNSGLEVAKGDWIAMLDSDDWIEPEMYEVLLELALKYDADISSCKSRNVGPDGVPLDKEIPKENNILVFDSDEVIADLLHQTHLRFEVWNKLFKRELIGNTRFVQGQIREDVHFDRFVFSNLKRFVYTTSVMHNYFMQRPGNINSSFKEASLCVYDEMNAWMKELLLDNRMSQADIVGCMAVDKAMADYVLALRTKQNREILGKINNYFDFFYQRIKAGSNGKKISIIIFRISPQLYASIVQCRCYNVMLSLYHSICK